MTPALAARPETAVVGLGAMGLPIAQRLAGSGRPVLGVEIDAARRRAAESAGVEIVGGLECLAHCRTVVSMVATADQLADLLSTAAPHLRPGQRWVLTGTYGVDAVVAAEQRLAALGVVALDSPVTGGVRGAESGTLTLFCSGSKEVYLDLAPVLAPVGNTHYVGSSVGDGQRLKAVNQLLCAVHLAAAAEAINLAERAGLNPETTHALLSGGAAGSWMLSDRGPAMVHGADVVRSTIDVFVKDTAIVARLAEASEAAVPLLQTARAQFREASASGLGRADDSQLIRTYRQQSPPTAVAADPRRSPS